MLGARRIRQRAIGLKFARARLDYDFAPRNARRCIGIMAMRGRWGRTHSIRGRPGPRALQGPGPPPDRMCSSPEAGVQCPLPAKGATGDLQGHPGEHAGTHHGVLETPLGILSQCSGYQCGGEAVGRNSSRSEFSQLLLQQLCLYTLYPNRVSQLRPCVRTYSCVRTYVRVRTYVVRT